MKLRRTTLAVVGIVKDGKKVLLTKRNKLLPEGGKWCLPGGHVKYMERAEEGMKRELKEEIGNTVEKSKFLFYHDEFVERIGVHAMVLVFSVEVKGKQKTNFEVSEVNWFDEKEINKMDLAFTHKEILKRYFNGENYEY